MKRLFTGLLCALLAAFLLCSCGGAVSGSSGGSIPSSGENHSSVSGERRPGEWDEGGDYTGEITVQQPQATGELVEQASGAAVDYSNAAKGYVMVKREGGSTRTKALVQGPDGGQYQYDISPDGSYEAVPLQMGSGSYQIMVLENIGGSNYSPLLTMQFEVQLESEFSPYLLPNQYVCYTASSEAVRKGYGLCMNGDTDVDKVASVYNWIVQNIQYDNEKAEAVQSQSGYLPDVDETLRTGKGICFDYAALMACMLRTQGIPTKLVIGNAGEVYHAWNEVYLEGIGWITVKIRSDGGWIRLDSTFAAGGTEETFLLNDENYTGQRYY